MALSRFNSLSPGEYTLQAESRELGLGRVESILVDAGEEARVQAALEFAFPSHPRYQVVFPYIEQERPPLHCRA